jgi:phage-related protein
MNTFLCSNKTQWRLIRTIVQGIIGVIIAYLDVILGCFDIPNEMRPMIVATVMAVLSPIMSCIKSQGEVITLVGGENDAVTDIEHEMYEPDDEEEDGDDNE